MPKQAQQVPTSYVGTFAHPFTEVAMSFPKAKTNPSMKDEASVPGSCYCYQSPENGLKEGQLDW
jgi:hypothetical protein